MQMLGIEAQPDRRADLRQLLRRNARHHMIRSRAGIHEDLVADRFHEIQNEFRSISDAHMLRSNSEHNRSLAWYASQRQGQRIRNKSAVLRTSLQKIHRRAADESGHEPIRRLAVEIERRD